LRRSRLRQQALPRRGQPGLSRRQCRRLRRRPSPRHQDSRGIMNAVESLRNRTARLLGIFICLHLPLILLIDWLRNGTPGLVTGIAAVIAIATGVMTFAVKGVAVRYFQAAAMPLTVATLVAVLSGHPWQIDMHMYFFASLAMLTAFCEWPVILIATATIAVHH